MTFQYICFSITSQCNMSCPYCYRIESDASSYMSKEHFISCISKLKALGCRVINITGGEPLLHPHWKAFIKLAKEYQLNIILSTNSLLLDIDDPILKEIDVLTIPLDSNKIDINSKTRNVLHYQCALSTITKFMSKKYPFKLKINTVLTKYNYDSLSHISNLVGTNTIWKVFLYREKGAFNRLPPEAIVSNEDYINKIEEISKLPISGVFMYDDSINDSNNKNNYTVVDSRGNLYFTRNLSDTFIGNLIHDETNSIFKTLEQLGIAMIPYKSLCGLDKMFL